MSFIKVTATNWTKPNILLEMSLETESRDEDPELEDGQEQYRAVLRVTIERDAIDILDLTQPSDGLISRASLPCRFNSDDVIVILPLKPLLGGGDDFPFKLTGQRFNPKGERGSRFFNAIQEYTSVSDWIALDWTAI